MSVTKQTLVLGIGFALGACAPTAEQEEATTMKSIIKQIEATCDDYKRSHNIANLETALSTLRRIQHIDTVNGRVTHDQRRLRYRGYLYLYSKTNDLLDPSFQGDDPSVFPTAKARPSPEPPRKQRRSTKGPKQSTASGATASEIHTKREWHNRQIRLAIFIRELKSEVLIYIREAYTASESDIKELKAICRELGIEGSLRDAILSSARANLGLSIKEVTGCGCHRAG